MSREWTEQQLNAINARGGSVLVSAAAGSGKTAVLVERVIRLITDADHPIDADRLLVVTFTRDAAAEMKQRIAKSLSDLLRDDPFNAQLLRQSKLLYSASICTIDSFCGDLVRDYFHMLGVSADYRIADQSELELLKAAAMDSAMEDFYNSDSDGFTALLDAFAGKGGDRNLRETVLKIHGFLETQPFPGQWLDDMLQSYGERSVTASIWGKIIIQYASPAVSHCINLCENSISLLQEADEKLRDKLVPIIEEDLVWLQVLQEKLYGENWDAIVTAVHSFSAKQLRAPRGYKDDPYKLSVAANRDNVKETVKRLQQYFCRTEDEARAELGELQEPVGVLFALTRHYIEQLDALKRKKNVLTFSDIELLAVRLLAVPDGKGGYEKTPQGAELARRFDAVIVDEFQDVNDVQNLIFNCMSQNEENLFTVGDVKQCIYGFRQAKPQIFVGRKESYACYDANNPVFPSVIILDKNFRSRAEVCDTVNFIFSRLMTKETAQMDYTREEYLNVGFSYAEAAGCETELAIIDKTALEGREGAEPEAAYIARRIREIMASDFLVTAGEERRRPTYGDFAVMLRSARGSAPAIVKALRDNGIPAYSEEKESAFDSPEVKLMLNLLRVIDNPTQDIPLLSVLCSPVYGFTPDELAQIRAKNRYASLFAAVEAAQHICAGAAAFCGQLASLRACACVSTVDELIGRALELTSLGAVTCAVSGGDTPMKNLNLLRHFARGFESGGGKTLSDFVFYIDRLIDNGVELPSASGGDAGSLNGVRVLSIHKSKGLEYPFCFLAGTAKRFNKRDLNADILIDNVAGLGIKRKVGVCRYNTLPRLAVQIEIGRNELAEELRVLYVALTRAREKLMIVGAVPKAEKYLADKASQLMFGSIIDPYTVTSSGCILDWMTLCALANPSSRKDMLRGAEQITVRGDYPQWEFRLINTHEQLASPIKSEELLRVTAEKPVTETDYATMLQYHLAYRYPNAAAAALPQKVSASQVAHDESGDYFEKIIAKPAFLSKEHSTSVERGTAHHLFLQYCDFLRARASLDDEIERLTEQGALSETQAKLIDRQGMTRLLGSPLFDRVTASPRVYREERFIVKLRPSLLSDDYPDTDEEIVMQGAVDLAFEEDGQLVIVDYKTDRVRDIEKLTALYRKQLLLYKEALQQAMEKEVRECLICSVALHDVIRAV